MKSPGDEIKKKAAQWAAYADEDMRFAEHGLTLGVDTPYRLVAYHAQQCAEKYIKSFLVFCMVDFPHTHNIAALLELCADHADWTGKLHDAEELTQFAISVRYPGEDEVVEKEEALRAIELARQVKTVIRGALADLGLNLRD